MTAAITPTQVSKASAELASMRRSLASWLQFRTRNDAVLVGAYTPTKPVTYAKRVILADRDVAAEQDLANKLYVLLGELVPSDTLPNPNLAMNPNAAVELARIAINGGATMTSPQAQGAAHPWMWPVLIVGGLLIAVTTAIKSAADVAKDAEEKACIKAGACTDYGFWLKAAGVVALGWFAWKELGVGDVVRSYIKKGRG